MSLAIYYHPFSSYSWKALIAIAELGLQVERRPLGPDAPENTAAWIRLWPMQKMPLLVEGDDAIPESSIIIEHLDLKAGGGRLLPQDAREALDVRAMDRFFDIYVMTPMQTIVLDRLRPEPDRDPYGVAAARGVLDTAYGWLEHRMAGRSFAAADRFSMADCAAAPALFYADWAHPLDGRFPAVAAYRARLLSRPSVAAVVDAARPYRPYFPLGAPDRD